MANTARSKDESGLFTEILSKAQEDKKLTCTVADVLAQLNDKDRADLTKALDTAVISGTAITGVLRHRGFDIKSHTVQRHRRGGCRCPR